MVWIRSWPSFLRRRPDKDLDGVGVAVEILIVKMFDEFGSRNDAALVMHQIGEQPVFERCELDRLAIDRNPPASGVEMQRTAHEFRRRVPGRAAQKRTQSCQHLGGPRTVWWT